MFEKEESKYLLRVQELEFQVVGLKRELEDR
jgi:hypothetical protein